MGARLLGTAMLSIAVWGCGPSRPSEEPSPVVSSGDEKPVEVGCPYSPPVGRTMYWVTLELRVGADGSVDPASVRVVKESGNRGAESVSLATTGKGDAALVERARAIALECKFKPAMVNGVAVPANVQKTFYFNSSVDQ